MGITFKNPQVVQNRIRVVFDTIDQRIHRTLFEMGTRCIEQARKLTEITWMGKTYNNQTGNLRSSIGFVIARNGVEVEFNGFTPPEGYAGTADTGPETGLLLARSVSETITSGWSMVVVAGMDYAAELETKNYDVLTSAEYLMDKELPIMLIKVKETI